MQNCKSSEGISWCIKSLKKIKSNARESAGPKDYQHVKETFKEYEDVSEKIK